MKAFDRIQMIYFFQRIISKQSRQGCSCDNRQKKEPDFRGFMNEH